MFSFHQTRLAQIIEYAITLLRLTQRCTSKAWDAPHGDTGST
ncbi:MAG: hypothetical protein V4525_08545 [Pseudomonadota bacterium]